MDKLFIQRLMRASPVLSLTLSVLLICGCSTMQPHLADNEIGALRSTAITIIYIKPSKELDAYLAQPSTVASAGVGFGFIGGFAGGLAAGLIDKKHYDDFMTKLDPYSDIIHKLPISDEVYSSTQNALVKVSWLKNADWQIVTSSKDSDFYHKMTREAKTPVAIFISPRVALRSDADATSISYSVDIYTKNPDDKYDIQRFDGGIITYAKAMPFDDAENQSGDKADDEIVNQRLVKIFADDGALLIKAIAETLPEADARLVYYLTGKKEKKTTTSRQ